MTAGIEDLLEGLPATLDALLEHPERHRPAVVERLLELTDEHRRLAPEEALALADAAQRLAARIPAFFPRDERFRLRAKSFEVWGSLKRRLGDDLSAEGGFMAALELLTQTDSQESTDLTNILGRHALLAGDRRDQPGVNRHVEAGIEIAQALDRDPTLTTIKPLLEAVMAEENAILPSMWTVLSLVANTTSIPDGGDGDTVGDLETEAHLTEDVDSEGYARLGFDIFLRRKAPAGGGLPWKISAHIHLYSQDKCDIFLIREVPSASAPGSWEVVEKMGWEVFSTEAVAEAADAGEGEIEAGSAREQEPG